MRPPAEMLRRAPRRIPLRSGGPSRTDSCYHHAINVGRASSRLSRLACRPILTSPTPAARRLGWSRPSRARSTAPTPPSRRTRTWPSTWASLRWRSCSSTATATSWPSEAGTTATSGRRRARPLHARARAALSTQAAEAVPAARLGLHSQPGGARQQQRHFAVVARVRPDGHARTRCGHVATQPARREPRSRVHGAVFERPPPNTHHTQHVRSWFSACLCLRLRACRRAVAVPRSNDSLSRRLLTRRCSAARLLGRRRTRGSIIVAVGNVAVSRSRRRR
jgi:hypothetical protein